MADEKGFDVRAIAAALTFVMPGWTLKPFVGDVDQDRPYRAHLTTKAGAELFLHRGYGDSRLSVSGSFPHGYQPHGQSFAITVDPTKDAGRIAADITRRILPTYLPKLAVILETRRANEAQKATARALVKDLARALRCHDPTTDERRRTSDLHHPTERWDLYPGSRAEGGIHKVTVDSYAPDRVDFNDVRATRAQALKLITLFRPPTARSHAHDGAPGRQPARRVARRRSRA